MSLTDEQRRAAYAPGSVAVTAGAGTGKTYMLAERYLYHLREDELSPLEVVAVTFTEKAATELRSRIRALAVEKMSDRPDILAELEAAPISTFHSLAAQICRDRAETVGIPADFRILDAIESQIWFDEQILGVLDELPEAIYDAIPYSLLRDVLPQLLDDPLSVRAAFARSPDTWEDLAQTLKNEAFEYLQNHPIWQNSLAVLPQYQGTANDSLEPQRQGAYISMQRIEAGERSPQLLDAIANINLRKKGSKKNWKSGGLELMRETLKQLRELVREVAPHIALELGEIDDRLAQILPALKDAFEYTWNALQQRKRQARVLSFADLEVYALEALAYENVRRDYAQRFQAILVDEFQDTNPTQGKLIDALSQNATLTVVGDAKQSIYSFRQADVRVFERFRDRIQRQGGDDVALSLCFRTHHSLIDRMNRIFRPLLQHLHQDLQASRLDAPQPEPHLQVFRLDAPPKTRKAQKRAAEAFHLTALVRQLLDTQTPIFDKRLGEVRPIQLGDIAILSRTAAPLTVYAEALETAGIPIALAGGGSLLDTREAKDSAALLHFLCDNDDDRALVAILRSPFFTVSDRALLQIAQLSEPPPGEPRPTWWNRLQHLDWNRLDAEDIPALNLVEILEKLRHCARHEAPSRVLQLADRLTGYTAVLANLPGASRRLADWRGFREFVRQLEGGDSSLWAVVRQLRRLVEVGAQVERLPLDASNAVSLMTIHASKGLEWAVVILADATYHSSHSAGSVVFDPEYGVAVKFGDDFEVSGKPLLYVWLERLQQQREAAETLRLLYVAFTRSRDRLFLTTCEPEGGLLDFLEPGLEAAGIPLETWAFPEAADLQFGDPEPPPLLPLGEVLVEPVQWVATDLPLLAIADYGECPQRFDFHYLQGYPGRAGEEGDRLLRRALAQGWRTASQLRWGEPDLTPAEYENVMAALQCFDESSVFEPLRKARFEERTLVWNSHDLHFHDTVLLWGETGVVLVRSPLDCDPDAYRLALEAIARTTGRSQLFLLDLQQNQLYTWASKPRERRLSKLLRQLRSGDTTATPSPERCDRCPYQDICGDRYVC